MSRSGDEGLPRDGYRRCRALDQPERVRQMTGRTRAQSRNRAYALNGTKGTQRGRRSGVLWDSRYGRLEILDSLAAYCRRINGSGH